MINSLAVYISSKFMNSESSTWVSRRDTLCDPGYGESDSWKVSKSYQIHKEGPCTEVHEIWTFYE